MAQRPQLVRVEEIDWSSTLLLTRIFRAFRMAIDPGKLLLALFLVVLLYIGGRGLDAVWQERVFPQEVVQYIALSHGDFDAWRSRQDAWIGNRVYDELEGVDTSERWAVKNIDNDAQRIRQAVRAIEDLYQSQQQALEAERKAASGEQAQAIRQRQIELYRAQRRRIESLLGQQRRGVFDTTLNAQITTFGRLVDSATSLRLGIHELLPGQPHEPNTVLGALREMAILIPGWLLSHHPWFLLAYSTYGLALWALLGGTIARIAAVTAIQGRTASTLEALGFASQRWLWFFAAYLLPVVVAGGLALVIILGGAVFFNLQVLDIIGAMIFPIALLLGLMLVLTLIGFLGGGSLLYPAVAVEGADPFDALSRSFNYMLGRPWRWAFYTLIALVYGAVTYLLVGTIIFMTLAVTHTLVNYGVWGEAVPVGRFDAIWPAPEFGRLAYEVDWSILDWSQKISAAILWVWTKAAIGMSAAYAISYFFCANTWVYLLLRRAADGTDFEEMYVPGNRGEKSGTQSARGTPAGASAAAGPVAGPVSSDLDAADST